jgi:hypothetical protein
LFTIKKKVMKKIIVLITAVLISSSVFTQNDGNSNKKNKLKELTEVLNFSEDQTKIFKKLSNEKKKVVHDQKVLIEAYQSHIKDAKQKSKNAKDQFDKEFLEMLSDVQKIKYQTYKSENKKDK